MTTDTLTRADLTEAVFQAVGQYGTDYTALCSGLIIALIPVVIVYLALQRQFISGLTAGALKGWGRSRSGLIWTTRSPSSEWRSTGVFSRSDSARSIPTRQDARRSRRA